MAIVKFSLGLLGAVTAAIAAVFIAVAVGLFTFVGSADAIEIPEIRVSTTDGRILAEDIDFLFEPGRFVPDLGTAQLHIRTADGTPVFAGVTDQATADRFLSGDIDPRRPTFWVTTAEGPTADLAWDLSENAWTFVVVGEDGTTPDEVLIGGTLSASPFRLAASTVAGLGAATGVAGGLILLAAARLGKRSPSTPQPTTSVPVAAGV